MSNVLGAPDFEKLTVAELEAAAQSGTIQQRRIHLDQASIFAALGEKLRGYALTGSIAGFASR